MKRDLTPEDVFSELKGSCKMAIDRKFCITATTSNYNEYKNKIIQLIKDDLLIIDILNSSCVFKGIK